MQIRPSGDIANDGVVQLSFTLPLPLNARAREVARRYAMLMGISNPLLKCLAMMQVSAPALPLPRLQAI
jgi:D-ornithine 4,5-aminomutase beta-subunit-like protein